MNFNKFEAYFKSHYDKDLLNGIKLRNYIQEKQSLFHIDKADGHFSVDLAENRSNNAKQKQKPVATHSQEPPFKTSSSSAGESVPASQASQDQPSARDRRGEEKEPQYGNERVEFPVTRQPASAPAPVPVSVPAPFSVHQLPSTSPFASHPLLSGDGGLSSSILPSSSLFSSSLPSQLSRPAVSSLQPFHSFLQPPNSPEMQTIRAYERFASQVMEAAERLKRDLEGITLTPAFKPLPTSYY